MTAATNTTEGLVVLTGDLTGQGGEPQLRPSGVAPGAYNFSTSTNPSGIQITCPEYVIDSKGRIIFANPLSTQLVPIASTFFKGIVQVNEANGLSISGGVMSLTRPDATTTTKGVMQVGTGLGAVDGTLFLNLPDATTSSKGLIQVGNGLSVAAGVVSVTPLVDATTSTKGVVQIGSGLAVNSGIMSIGLPNATASVKGIVQAGGGINVESGVMSVVDASTASKGLMQVGAGLSVTDGIISAIPIEDATVVSKGVVRIGDGLSITNGVLSLRLATAGQKGIVQVGNGLDVSGGILSLTPPNATTSSKGVIRGGLPGVNFDSGIVSIDLPDATSADYGAVQIGEGLEMSGDTLNAINATTSVKGVVQIGSGLSVTDGTVSLNAPDATASTKGVVQIGSGLSVTDGTVSLNAPDATASTKGVVQIGSGFDSDAAENGILSISQLITDEDNFGLLRRGTGLSQYSSINGPVIGLTTLNIPTASKTVFGRVIVGNRLTVSEDGELVRPNLLARTQVAFADRTGVVIAGDGFDVSGSGVLSLDDSNIIITQPNIFTDKTYFSGSGNNTVGSSAINSNTISVTQAAPLTNVNAFFQSGGSTTTIVLQHFTGVPATGIHVRLLLKFPSAFTGTGLAEWSIFGKLDAQSNVTAVFANGLSGSDMNLDFTNPSDAVLVSVYFRGANRAPLIYNIQRL